MKILISAYACAPNRGSEHGSAWNWIAETARQGHEIWALVSPAHRVAIEAACSRQAGHAIHWVFPSLSWWRLEQGQEPKWERSYNLLWQKAALTAARDLAAEIRFDIVHHLTWGGIRAPTFLGSLGPALIIGPLGGGETSPPSLRRRLPLKGRVLEWLRDFSSATILVNPMVRAGLRQAAVIFARTAETRNVLGPRLRGKTLVMMEMGISQDLIGHPRSACQSPPKLLFAGRLIYWKGIHIAIEALAQLAEKLPGTSLTIVGSGPDENSLRAEAASRGLDGLIRFVSSMPQDKFFELYDRHDIFVFPSLHDSEGWVVLEALCKGMPVICLDLGGPKEIVTPESGSIVVTADLDTTQVAQEIANQICGIATTPNRYAALSSGAIARAHDFLLSDRVTELYRVAADHIDDCAGQPGPSGSSPSQEGKMFFAEEKNQKTSYVLSRIRRPAYTKWKKSLASFLQKRRPSLNLP